MDVGIELRRAARTGVRFVAELRVVCRGGAGEMSGIEQDREVGTATLGVRAIDGAVQARLKMRADRRDEMAAGGEPDHADLVRVDVPFRGARPDQAERALGVLQR